MKLIVINRRKLGVTFIMVGLMIILLGLELTFDSKLKLAALVQNNISSLKSYSGLENKFTYKLPFSWTTEIKDVSSNEIAYHNEFYSDDRLIHGFVQAWETKTDLKNFLDKSKEISLKGNVVKNYKISPITINKHNGYLVTYTIKTSKDTYYRCYEYFIEDTNKYFRFSFFVKEQNFKENMTSVFKIIVESLEYKE